MYVCICICIHQMHTHIEKKYSYVQATCFYIHEYTYVGTNIRCYVNISMCFHDFMRNQSESSLDIAWSCRAQYLIDHQIRINQMMTSIAPALIFTKFDSCSLRISRIQAAPSLGQGRGGECFIDLNLLVCLIEHIIIFILSFHQACQTIFGERSLFEALLAPISIDFYCCYASTCLC